ncbi:GNAT family N-acetyltransferase [Rhodococcus sp. NBC_00297]|uniref:GNAT family N-acetyltransferase n=1 Tax=Rhodococcus sp. NBC_00297 TaxID=2976005 RepID=UPI002E281497|nr:GNAT family N-acetyltransferase [Rhodococcus sp. NBC_00297]
MTVVAVTARLTLRTYSPDDEHRLDFYTDPEVCRYLMHEPWTAEDARIAVQRRCERTSLDTGAMNALVELNGRVIGTVSAWFVAEDTVELGWTFARDVSGHGYATEAVQAMLDEVLALDRVRRVTAEMDARNAASARLAQRVGLRDEELRLQDCWCKGEWTDTLVYSLSR